MLVVATGPYVGEGFDCPALDTLFLAAPIAFKGTMQEAMTAARRAIDSIERSKVVRQERGYMYAEFASKLCQRSTILVGGKRFDGETALLALKEIDGARSDRTRGAQDDDALHLNRSPVSKA